MKITIVESEIQEAIRAHIERQITIKPGMAITMEIRATRGDDGFIANIDISPAKDGVPAPVEKVTVQAAQAEAPVVRPRVTRQAAAKAVEPAPAPTPEVEGEAEPGAEDAPFDGGEVVTNDETTNTVEEVAPAADDGVQEVEGAAPLKRSIFAGLNRPTNSEAEAA